MRETAHSHERTAIPATASPRVDPDQLEQMWAMRPAQRIQAALEGRFTLGEMLRWAARRPDEPPLVDGEWFFLSAYLADCEHDEPDDRSGQRSEASRDTSDSRPAAAGDPSKVRTR